jgi:thiamine-phosphate pyrophosphorylase
MKLRGLYAITDEILTPYGEIDRYVCDAIAGGAKIVQLRDKTLSDEELYPVAKKIKKICKKNGALFVLDDRVVLAKAINADGVHIGGDDTPIELAREILGSKKIIGISCYGDIARAKDAVKKSADYVAFGSFFVSKTKPHAKVVPQTVLTEAKKLGVPLCAIGGIEASNAGSLVEAGADMISVINALWSGDIMKNAKEFAKVF